MSCHFWHRLILGRSPGPWKPPREWNLGVVDVLALLSTTENPLGVCGRKMHVVQYVLGRISEARSMESRVSPSLCAPAKGAPSSHTPQECEALSEETKASLAKRARPVEYTIEGSAGHLRQGVVAERRGSLSQSPVCSAERQLESQSRRDNGLLPCPASLAAESPWLWHQYIGQPVLPRRGDVEEQDLVVLGPVA